MSLTKIYFPNLNGLRFIAAFMVIVYHIEQFLSYFGYQNLTRNPVIKLIGPLGVELFFVLSGFLITYLILAEEKVTKTISIKDFYIRRILRIWPLYYFVGFLAFFVLPHLAIFNIPIYSDIFSGNFDISSTCLVSFLDNNKIDVICTPNKEINISGWKKAFENSDYNFYERTKI